MRASQFLLTTLKETPADAEVISHQLMLRAGLIRRVAAGIYNWMPLGLRVLRKVEQVVREEMNRAGALEIAMPVVQPAELWQESGRWEQYGPELARLQDRHDRDFCLGPTHEEIITALGRGEIKSYKQLPLNFYQIQTKFRDEIRPRFGIMRSREFIMKDAYSFHADQASLETTYWRMHAAYSTIFTRLGLDFRAVVADTGSIGGNHSHEFHVLAESGEDAIAFSSASDYASNVEMAEALALQQGGVASEQQQRFATPGVKTIEDLVASAGIPIEQTVKTLFVEAEDDGIIALVLRGDHRLSSIKAEKLTGVARPLQLANAEAVSQLAGAGFGSLGPVDLRARIIVDRSAATIASFVCGANEDGFHLRGVNWQRDVVEFETADIREVMPGDPSPCGSGTLEIRRGIEVGHIFQLGTKYSEAMDARVLDEGGKTVPMAMGCYGIGVTRIVAAAIEQNHDDRGILWPDAMAPFEVALVPLNMDKSELVASATEKLYGQLTALGIEVFMDDRKERPGVKFAEMELIGIPLRVTLGERSLAEGKVEVQARGADAADMLAADTAADAIVKMVHGG